MDGIDELEKFELVRIKEIDSDDPVGIDNLPHQLVAKRFQEDFPFNILLIGETGVGKSTLISCLFNLPLDDSLKSHSSSVVELKSHTHVLREKGVCLKLTLIETVGYGDQINGEGSVKNILKWIDNQFEAYFAQDSKFKRSWSDYHDTRIHACLYFVCPTGRALKPLDIFCLKQLHGKVNIIPIIAKADSLSKEDLQGFKITIRNVLENEGIKIYEFPTEDEEISEVNSRSNAMLPFAVSASKDYVDVAGRSMPARVFPWGTMLVEDEEHSEFSALKQALILVNMEDMREKTNNKFYEKYRRNRMIELGYEDAESYQEMYEKQRKKFRQEMLRKEDRLREKYIEKVRAKDAEIKMLETAMIAKYNDLFAKHKEDEKKIRREQKELESEMISYKNKLKMKMKLEAA